MLLLLDPQSWAFQKSTIVNRPIAQCPPLGRGKVWAEYRFRFRFWVKVLAGVRDVAWGPRHRSFSRLQLQ